MQRGGAVDRFTAIARQRIAVSTGSDLPQVQALLRRLREEGGLPSFHPLVDLCNAASAAFAIPIAVIDLDKVAGDLQTRPALDTEACETFAGNIDHPDPGEVIFAGDGHRADAGDGRIAGAAIPR